MIMINDFKIKIVRHSDLNSKGIDEIIRLKKQHWNYSLESQKKWIKENLNDDDYHICFEVTSGKIIAYLNIVNLEIIVNSKTAFFLGIGNVCVDKNIVGSGLGLLLMQTANYFIKNKNKIAVLLCKESLISFYTKANWHKYNGDTLLKNKKFEDTVMFSEEFKGLNICITRNF